MNLISSCKESMMSLASSSACRVASEVVPYQFPAGLRVLVVDDDRPTLLILDKMLRTCLYDVRTCNRAEEALSLLRGNKNGFDIVLSDVHMPDMDGFKLLEHIGLEMELPVIMMSMDAGKDVVMKGITHGACDYLIKPVSLEALKNIWQHVVRKKKNEWKDLDQLASADEYGDWQQKLIGDVDYSSSANEGSCRSAKRRKVDEEEAEDKDDSSALKKPRVVWSVELHQQFVDAVNQLGIDSMDYSFPSLKFPLPQSYENYHDDVNAEAVPKKILELMDVPGLTRENVASHLQKYRLYLRRLSGGSSHHQNNLANSFLNPQEAALGSISSLNGFHLHSLPVTSQMQAQSVVAPNPGMSTISVANQRNLFTFENPKLNPNMSKPINLLHGISTTLGSKNLTNFHHSTQSHGSMITQMPQPQSSAHIFNKTTSINSNIQRLPSSIGHPIFSNGIANGGVVTTNRAGFSLVPSTSSILNSGVSHQIVELPGNSFPLQSTPLEMPTLTPKRGFAQELSPNSDVKGSGGFFQSYDVFSGLTLQNSNDWDLHYNIGLSFDASRNLNRIRPSLDVSSSGLVHQGFSSGIIGPTTFVGDNSMSVRAEKILDSSRQIGGILGGNFGQEDILSALLKQQEGIGTAETEFDFDGICIDNIPV